MSPRVGQPLRGFKGAKQQMGSEILVNERDRERELGLGNNAIIKRQLVEGWKEGLIKELLYYIKNTEMDFD